MTLQNSMNNRKLKNYQAFDHTRLSSVSVCVCVCVCVYAGPALCVCVDCGVSEWVGVGLSVQCDRE